MSETEERPAAEPEGIGPEPEGAGQVLASASVESGAAGAAAGAVDPVAAGAGTVDPVAAAAGTVDPVAAAAGTVDPVAAAAGTVDPVAAAAGTVDPVVAAGTAVTAGAPAAETAASPAGGHRTSRRRTVLGWAAATIAVGGIAWLLISLITVWTSYATLTVANWQMTTDGPHSARVSLLVRNSGTASATGCTIHIQLGNGQAASASSPPISPGASRQYYLRYQERGGPQTHPAYAWAACDGAQTPSEHVATIANMGLFVGSVHVAPGPATTTLSLALRNLGTQEAYACHGYARFTGGKTVTGTGAPSNVRGGGSTVLSVDYATSLGHPRVAWAECHDPPASNGVVFSTRAYLRSLFRSS
jgi:hypothetical protein